MSSQIWLVVFECHVLIRVNTDCPEVFFCSSFKQTVACAASCVVNHISTLAVHVAGNFLCLSSVLEVADKAADNLDIRVDIISTLHVASKELLDPICFHAADAANDARSGNGSRNNTSRIASFVCCIGNCIDIV